MTKFTRIILRLKRTMRVFFWPTILMVLLLEIGVFTLTLHLKHLKEINKTSQLAFESAMTLLATFIGIFVPLLINRNLKKEDKRRSLTFSLSFLWSELRSNLHILNQIKSNYEFSKMIQGITNPYHLLPTLSTKYEMIHAQDSLFKTDAYSAIQSGAATAIDEDEYFNFIMQSYENLSLYRSASLMVVQDLNMKVYMHAQEFDPLSAEESQLLLSAAIIQMKKAYSELLFAIGIHNKAIDLIVKKLEKLGIKPELELREVPEEVTLR